MTYNTISVLIEKVRVLLGHQCCLSCKGEFYEMNLILCFSLNFYVFMIDLVFDGIIFQINGPVPP